MVALVQEEFGEGRLAEEATWKAVVLITMGGGDYDGIDLVEMVGNVVAVIINCRFTAYITIHDVLVLKGCANVLHTYRHKNTKTAT